jgi:hypothetical protein
VEENSVVTMVTQHDFFIMLSLLQYSSLPLLLFFLFSYIVFFVLFLKTCLQERPYFILSYSVANDARKTY